MKFDRADLNDNRIKNYSDGWVDDLEEVPFIAGVFLFVDEAEDVKYLGWSTNAGMRNKATEAWNGGRGRGATKGGWIQCFSDVKAKSLYDELLAKYQPPNN